MWTKDAGIPTVGQCTGGFKTWLQGLDYVACLNANNYLGYTDWRLPNVNELESLVQARYAYNIDWLISQGFVNVAPVYGDYVGTVYWSSTSVAKDTGYAYVVYMDYPSIAASYKWVNHSVWAVRGNTFGPAQLWKTGQKENYYPGDDGDLEGGVNWPQQRFTTDSNTTVTDNLTGLMWTKDAKTPGPNVCSPGILKSWSEALDHITCLNANNYGGYNDWRLPNRKECRSLIDYSCIDPSLPSNHPFTNITSGNPGDIFWTSTTPVTAIEEASWIVFLNEGYIAYVNKTNTYLVWPVRGGILNK